MDTYDVIREAARRAGVPTTHIGPAMGKTPGYLANGAARGSTPRADTVARMLDVCGYVLCAVPHGDVPPSAIVIDAPTEQGGGARS